MYAKFLFGDENSDEDSELIGEVFIALGSEGTGCKGCRVQGVQGAGGDRVLNIASSAKQRVLLNLFQDLRTLYLFLNGTNDITEF